MNAPLRLGGAGERRGALVLSAYAVLAGAAAFTFADQINPDGIVYLRIARYYGSGDLGRAVSAYWSPLYSWLLVPWLALGVPGLLATKLLGALLAVAWVHGVGLLLVHYVESQAARALLLGAAAVGALGWSMRIIAPDLLLAVLLTYYFHLVGVADIAGRPGRALGAGLLGGLAFLAKAYALPFFLVHFLGTMVLTAWAGRSGAGSASDVGRWRRLALATGAGLLGCALLAGPWIAVLSATHGRLTVTTVMSRNQPLVGDVSIFLPFALRVPPEQRLARLEPGRLTQWETPDRFQPTLLSAPVVSDPGAVRRGRIREIGQNLIVVRDRLAGFDYFQLAIPGLLAAVFLAGLYWRERVAAVAWLWGAFTVSVYALGYLPLVAGEQRYFWPVAGLLLALAGGAAEKFAAAATARVGSPSASRVKLAAVALVAMSFLITGAQGLGELLSTPRPQWSSMARAVRDAARRNGAALQGPIAGNEWPRALYTAHVLDLPMAGVTTARDPTGLAEELDRAGVRLYLIFDDRGLAAKVLASGRFRHLGDLTPRGARGSIVAAFEVPARAGG